MTLIKSLLLGSAAGIVAVATAQAADLPTRKAAPVEYVRVCNVGGITGWTLPGSDTCVKFSGYMTAHFIGGNISSAYNDAAGIVSLQNAALNPFAASHLAQTLMVEGGDGTPNIFNGSGHAITVGGVTYAPGADINGPAGAPVASTVVGPGAVTVQRLISANPTPLKLPNQQNSIFNRNAIGWNIRANFGFDLASNTAYGPLIGHFDLNSDLGNGSDSPNGSFKTHVNTLAMRPGRASRLVRRSRSTRSSAAATTGTTSSRLTRRASTSRSCWPTPPRSAAASRRRSLRKVKAQTGPPAAAPT